MTLPIPMPWAHGRGFPNKGGLPMSSNRPKDLRADAVPMFTDVGHSADDSDRLQLFFGWAFTTQWFELLQAADLPGLLAFNKKLRAWLARTYGEHFELLDEFDIAIARLTDAVERRAS
jgi:hypothetical protein